MGKRFIGMLMMQTSTWRGFIYLLIALGMNINPDQQAAVISLGLAFAGLIGVFLPDKLNGSP